MTEEATSIASKPALPTLPVAPETTFADFLERVPPSQIRILTDAIDKAYSSGAYGLKLPDVVLHCSSTTCNGNRVFRCSSQEVVSTDPDTKKKFLIYTCSNCRSSNKTFAIAIWPAVLEKRPIMKAYKFGEEPVFGPITPTRLLKLLGDQREVFLKGRRCENQGLGIGAFGYYRRVVENQKNRILDEIIKVSQKLGASAEALADLELAKEHQFLKSVESIKHGIPQTLLINGHNPLTLLHAALSVGLHDQTDERCLELAHDVRIVLGELSDRLSNALKDEVELNSAVGRLLRARE